ncbi:MAG: peptide ABC transporter substrate-binding protein [Patescibacteria group bacterium]
MFSGFIKLFKSFSGKEYIIFFAAFLVFFVSASLWVVEFINQKTTLAAIAGGNYIEGLAGQPSFINPILAVNDIDRDLSELIFSDLADLAESYKPDKDGKIWRYRLKDGVKWHNGKEITSDDIIFTIETVQNQDVRSSLFQNWQGVAVERISEREIELKLPTPYVFFKSALESLRPIPKHIFSDIPASNLRLSNYNLEPIGSGPYKFLNLKKRNDGYIISYNLEINDDYFADKPYIKKISFAFYNNEADIIDAFNSGEIHGFGLLNYENLSKVIFPHQVIPLKMLKYYAIFLNNYSHLSLKEKNVRLALNLAINKQAIIEKVFDGQADIANSPLVDGIKGFDNSLAGGIINLPIGGEKANQILDNSGWLINKENIREKKIGKDLIKLEFILTVPDAQPLIETAKLIKNDWEKIGVKADISIVSLSEINSQLIKSRDYQMLLFGNILGEAPDLYSFWHSSEKFYPGLNLALYENKTADRLIESIRNNFDNDKRNRDLSALQSIIIDDQPAIFIYSPKYIYIAKKTLSGFDSIGEQEKFISFSSDRFKNVQKWYVKTARMFK